MALASIQTEKHHQVAPYGEMRGKNLPRLLSIHRPRRLSPPPATPLGHKSPEQNDSGQGCTRVLTLPNGQNSSDTPNALAPGQTGL